MSEYEYAYTNFKQNGVAIAPKVDILIHHVHINRYFIGPLISWCTENCVSPWGWYFDLKLGTFMGFANIEEKTLFCLVNDYD